MRLFVATTCSKKPSATLIVRKPYVRGQTALSASASASATASATASASATIATTVPDVGTTSVSALEATTAVASSVSGPGGVEDVSGMLVWEMTDQYLESFSHCVSLTRVCGCMLAARPAKSQGSLRDTPAVAASSEADVAPGASGHVVGDPVGHSSASSSGVSGSCSSSSSSGVGNGPGEEGADAETFVAFARIFSGTLRANSEVYVFGPKYDPGAGAALDSAAARSAADGTIAGDSGAHDEESLVDSDAGTLAAASAVATTSLAKGAPMMRYVTRVTGGLQLFLMMGRDLEPVSVVPAGNVFGMAGLDKVSAMGWGSQTQLAREELVKTF
jgi:translation elongation factor EF-G